MSQDAIDKPPRARQALADLLPQVMALRERLDRLAGAPADSPSLGDRLAQRFSREDGPPKTLRELDGIVERAGLHTLADARLFASLMKDDPRLATAGERLARGAKKAVRELGRGIAATERHKRVHTIAPADLEELELDWSRLLRVVKVARLLIDPQSVRHEELYELLPSAPRPKPGDPRVAAAEFYLTRACDGGAELPQRRRDLQAAHELLLHASLETDRRHAQELRLHVARARRDMAQLARADPLRAVARAVQKGDGTTLWEATAQAYRDAVRAQDAALATASRRLLDTLQARAKEPLLAAIAREDSASQLESSGEGALAELLRSQHLCGRDRLAEIAQGLDPTSWSSAEIASDAGDFFDVEDAGDEEVPEEEEPRRPTPMVRVPYPSAQMSIELAQGIEELSDFVIEDPRLVLYDLASQRQLVRAHFEPQEEPPRPPKVRRGAVRVYVLDASGSMGGARARFRDAILMSELNRLTVLAARGRPFAPLYFAFFNDVPTELMRVDTPAKAGTVIANKLFGRAAGNTDITLALVSAFATIREARGKDPDLGRATVVLITDGLDDVDAGAIAAARAPVKEVEITLSLIGLGRENPALKSLVTTQRSAGKRAFYYFLDDDEVAGARGLFDTELRTLLPARAAVELSPDDPELQRALAALLELGEERARAGRSGPSPSTRFAAYFPTAPPVDAGVPADPALVTSLLAAVAQTAAMAPAESRAGEAVELLEHLLRTYVVSVPEYLRALAELPAHGREALEKIRLLCPMYA